MKSIRTFARPVLSTLGSVLLASFASPPSAQQTSPPPAEPTEANVTSRLQSQFHDDSFGWKVGLDVAHKSDDYDLLVATSFLDRGITYDGNGRRIGLNTSGSLADTESKNLFIKVGSNFGADR